MLSCQSIENSFSSPPESKYDSTSDAMLQNLLAQKNPTLEQIEAIIKVGLAVQNSNPLQATIYLRFAIQFLRKNKLNCSYSIYHDLCKVLFEIYNKYPTNPQMIFHIGIALEYALSQGGFGRNPNEVEIIKAFEKLALNQPEIFDDLLKDEIWKDVDFALPAYLSDFISHRNLMHPLPTQRNLDIFIKYRAAQPAYDSVIDDFLNEKDVKPEILKCKFKEVMKQYGYAHSKIQEIAIPLSFRQKFMWCLLHTANQFIFGSQEHVDNALFYYREVRDQCSEAARAILATVLLNYQFFNYINDRKEAKSYIAEEIAFFENAYRTKPTALSLLALTELSALAPVSISFEFNPLKIKNGQLNLLKLHAEEFPYVSFVLGEYYCYQITQISKLKNITENEKQKLATTYSDEMKKYYILSAASGYAPAVEKYLKHYHTTPENFWIRINEKDFFSENRGLDSQQVRDLGQTVAFKRLYTWYGVGNIADYCNTPHLECTYHARLALINPPNWFWNQTLIEVHKDFDNLAINHPELLGELVRSYNDSLDHIKLAVTRDIYQHFLEKRIVYLNVLVTKNTITQAYLFEQLALLPELCDIVFSYSDSYLEKDINELAKLQKALFEISPQTYSSLSLLNTPSLFSNSGKTLKRNASSLTVTQNNNNNNDPDIDENKVPRLDK